MEALIIVAMPLGSRARNAAPRQVVTILLQAIPITNFGSVGPTGLATVTIVTF